MNFYRKAILIGLFVITQAVPVTAETIRLKSGREVQMVDGRVPEKVGEEIYREAERFLKKGRLDLAGEHYQFLLDRGKGDIVSRAKAAQGEVRRIEYGSFVVLRNGRVFKGKVRADLRSDLFGLEGRQEIPLWQVEEIVAEYHPGYSFVSGTFYPLTLLEIKLRDRELQTSKITGEVEFVVEAADGLVTKAVLGKAYQLFRPEGLAKQLQAAITDRIIKIVVYPDLRRPE